MFSALARDDLPTDERMALWERQTRWWIVLAAVAPFVTRLIPGDQRTLNLTVDLVTWGIFLADFVVHQRFDRAYWRSGRGIFDISILLLTFPWYVVPAVGGTAYTMAFRWARLARLMFSGETGRRFVASMRRLGTLGIALVFTSVLAALIVLRNEPPDAGFNSFGDALWWSVVSFTTVGYGDLYPTTPAGRLAGGLMMFMGLMALGTVSGVLASTFTGERVEDDEPAASNDMLTELRLLRQEVADLRNHLGAGGDADPEDASPPADGTDPPTA